MSVLEGRFRWDENQVKIVKKKFNTVAVSDTYIGVTWCNIYYDEIEYIFIYSHKIETLALFYTLV